MTARPTAAAPRLLPLAAAALVVAIGGGGWLALRGAQRSAAESAIDQAALLAVEQAHGRTLRATNAVRGYVITGDTTLLAGVSTFGADARRETAQAVAHLREDPALAPLAAPLATAVDARLAAMEALVASRRTARVDDPTVRAAFLRSSETADSLGARVEATQRRLLARIADRQGAERSRAARVAWLLGGGTALAALLALLADRSLARLLGRARRDAAALADRNGALEQQRTELERQRAYLHEQAVELEAAMQQLQEQAGELEAANEQLQEQASELEATNTELNERSLALEAANDRLQQQQAALEEAALRDRLLFERAPVPIWVFDVQTLAFVAVNDAAVALYGWTREEFLRMTIRDIRPPEDVPVVERLVGQHREGETTRRLSRHLTRDGRLLTTLLVAHDAVLGGRRVRVVTAEDVSEREALERQLRESQKMEAVGQLAGGVAHDFNNLLTVVQGALESAAEQGASATPWGEELAEAREATLRAAQLTRQLLAFSRRQITRPAATDLHAVVEGATRLLRRAAELPALAGTTAARLVVRADDPRPLPVHVDVAQLEQALLNLVINARDALLDGGTITVSTGLLTAARPGATGAAPRAWATVRVHDTGIGMDGATRERIFEPFFTTKPHGKGTGLGLSTTFGIVQQAGGFLTVDSAPGTGSTFTIHLPLDDGTPPDPAPGFAPGTASGLGPGTATSVLSFGRGGRPYAAPPSPVSASVSPPVPSPVSSAASSPVSSPVSSSLSSSASPEGPAGPAPVPPVPGAFTDAREPAAAPSSSPAAADGAERAVLVVEDEAGVRQVVTRTLQRAGFAVVAVGSASDALAWLASVGPGGAPRCLLTDVVMPEMSGTTLASRFLEVHPTVPVVYMSGYTEDADALDALRRAGARFLAKPFTGHALVQTIREAIGASDEASDAGPAAASPR